MSKRDRDDGSSGLRGLGGAGFPAGRKWRIVRAEAGPRLMAVNIDEGEPGTFKDRVYLERDPHRFLEGMLIAAWAVGIETIYIYLRDEYHGCRAMLEAELAKLRARSAMAGMPRSSCGAAPAPTSAAKSRP
jgi:NADH:ubiquinone oxidoreductase subunit F (NADH-binding)